MIGKTISHYEILEKLGEGGMGVVYRARDTKLDRPVAMKFLAAGALGSEEDQARLAREAKSAAALNHPSICTIYEIDQAEGRTFIAMECVEGECLKDRIESGRVEPAEAVDIAAQVAEGLQQAHKKGIVHRDIKPANVMVGAGGRVKIMDFGLAKAGEVSVLTKTGTTLGTVAYMSPEQAHGDAVDHRTDLWSLGVVLYEMVTGRRPFRGDYEPAVVYSILNQIPEPLTALRTDAPVELERIVGKALAKDPDERYQNAGELAAELKSLRQRIKPGPMKEDALSAASLPSVAVLPFRDMSPQKDQDYFCEGMAEELINALTKLEGLKVAARTSAFHFKGRDEDIRRIGDKLGVTTVLEGSVRKAGERLRVTVQLINVHDGYHLWSERFDRDMEDVFAIQDEISLAVVDKLRVKLLKDDRSRLVKRHTQDQEAYNLYLKGRYFWNRRYERGLQEGIKCFEQAIEKDPSYAPAYAGIADCYISLAHFGWMPPTEGFPKARAAAEKALDIDSTLGEAHASLGWIKTCHDWDWSGAERSWKKAIELAPNYAGGRAWYAVCLTPEKRLDEGWDQVLRAYELDPLSLVINMVLGLALSRRGKHDEALVQYDKTRELDPNFQLTYLFQSWTYAAKGMWEDAISSLNTFISISGGSAFGMGCLGSTYAMSGRKKEALETLERLQELSRTRYVSPYYLAITYMGLGDKERVFEYLERAYVAREPFLVFMNTEPLFSGLRPDPRFADLIKRIGLEM